MLKFNLDPVRAGMAPTRFPLHRLIALSIRRTRTSRNRLRLSRSDRAKIRILHELGLKNVDIAVEVDCASTTVGLILQNATHAAAKDDPERDYDFVDNDFKARYPPRCRSPSV